MLVAVDDTAGVGTDTLRAGATDVNAGAVTLAGNDELSADAVVNVSVAASFGLTSTQRSIEEDAEPATPPR